MNKTKISLMLLIVCIALIYSGCAPSSKIDHTNPTALPPEMSESELDALFDSLLTRPALAPDELPSDIICTDYTSRGLLRICYQSDTDAKIKLQVMAGDNAIAYNLNGDGSIEDFSLQYGDGEYTARIMENIKDDEYVVVESKEFVVMLSSENDVYLNAVQNVDWDYDTLPIDDVRYIVAKSLIDAKKDGLKFSCAADLYEYIISNIDYDDAKVRDLLYNYLPDIEQTYVDGKGICYDYASLLAAMLRSINIPTKLVKGYASYNPNVYHAWNEVYIDGHWVIIDATRDATLLRSGAQFEPQKDPIGYTSVYEY